MLVCDVIGVCRARDNPEEIIVGGCGYCGEQFIGTRREVSELGFVNIAYWDAIDWGKRKPMERVIRLVVFYQCKACNEAEKFPEWDYRNQDQWPDMVLDWRQRER